MSRSNRQYGFTVVELIILIGFVLAIGGVGYFVMHHDSNKAASTQTSADKTDNTPSAPAIKDTSDLDTADKTLDQTNVDAATSDGTELDSLTNGF